MYIIKFIYSTFLLPPGIFIILILLLGLKVSQKQRSMAAALFFVALLIYAASISFVSDKLISSLESRYKPPVNIHGDVIVMLGGGATLDTPNIYGKGHLSGSAANRLLTTVMLYQKLKVSIIISGGKVYRTTGREADIAKTILLGLNITDEKIIKENRSLNTTENAKFTKKIIQARNFKKVILVTSAFHMPRAVRQFEKAGVKVTPFPTDYHTNIANTFAWQKLIPTSEALEETSIAMKEYIGLLAVRWY